MCISNGADEANFNFRTHLQRQREWSARTFGPGPRAAGVVDHIRKELREIEADPADLREWIDVAILALDGAWRTGASPEEIIAALVAKQARNEARAWPDWRTVDPNKAIEHDRSREPCNIAHSCGKAIAEPVAWVHEEDPARVISAAQKDQALRDGGASASSVRPYSIAAYTDPAPSASPAAEQRDECGMTEGDWKRAEALTDMPGLQDAQIDAVANAMPGGLDGFLKGWGWRQFARQIEDAVLESASPAALTATDEMIDAACNAVPDLYRVDAMRAIEAAFALLAAQPAAYDASKHSAECIADDCDGCLAAEPARADRQGVALSDEAYNLLLSARNAIDQLPGYPKGAALCDEIDSFIARASSRTPLQQATAEHDADTPAACYAGAMVESRQGVALSDEAFLNIAKELPMQPWGIGSCDTDLIPFARAILSLASSSRAVVESAAARDVLAERRRQVEAEGWTPEHDDQHDPGTLSQAAGCYIEWNGYENAVVPEGAIPINWPWAPEWWKPSDDRRNLVKAGALILAEIERIDRLATAEAPNAGEQHA